MENLSVLGDLSPQQFLDEYWQKKPVVIRQAFPDLELPFTAEELAGITCDTDAPSRIIVEHGLAPNPTPWQDKHGPFTDEDFTSLPDTHWTFLVNDLERYVPELGNLIEPFRFIPDWRIDDLMVSYAADQGSVGPHTDEYDVFLIQGMGKRRWNIISHDDYPKDIIPDLSLSILAEFESDQEWLLEAGDMLYLPPNMPHYGVAEGECMTFSVGFRAPSQQELIQNWVESFTDKPAFKQRFSDERRKVRQSSGEIQQDDIDALSQLLLDGIHSQENKLSNWLGKYLTETRGDYSQNSEAEKTQQIKNDNPTYNPNYNYERETSLRFAYIEAKDTAIIDFFANGKHVSLPIQHKKMIQQLCSDYYYSADSLTTIITNPDFLTLFNELIADGGIYPAD